MEDFEVTTADMLEIVAGGGNGAEYVNIVGLIDQAAKELREKDSEIERLREALLTAQAMLSEMGLPSAEKCQMAYDFLYDIARAALGEEE
jgi:hypothetical protein